MSNGFNPPNYEQSIGPNFIPIGAEKDLEQARRLAGSSKVYAALRPTEDIIQKIINGEYVLQYFLLPWGWPFIPCAIPSMMDRSACLRNTLYVITEDSVLVSVADYTPPCACGCTTGRDSCELTFENIVDVKVDNRGQGCGSFRAPCVTLCLVNKEIVLFVESTEGVAHLIRQLRRARKEGPSIANAAAVVQQPVGVMQPLQAAVNQKKKRVFVARNDDPSSFTIINIKGETDADWQQFLDDVRRALQFHPASNLSLTLADINAAVTAAEQLETNDKVIVAS